VLLFDAVMVWLFDTVTLLSIIERSWPSKAPAAGESDCSMAEARIVLGEAGGESLRWPEVVCSKEVRTLVRNYTRFLHIYSIASPVRMNNLASRVEKVINPWYTVC
jgi:hypothetical protein